MALMAWFFKPNPAPHPVPHAQIQHNAVRELSGIIASSRFGEYWGVNDSGNAPNLFRFNAMGDILSIIRVREASNRDWEALSRDPNGYLYIGDIGDNDKIRRESTIYQFKEPKLETREITPSRRIQFHYADRQAHNCEALFFFQSNLYLITKEKLGKRPILFRVNPLSEAMPTKASTIGKLDIKNRVSDAAFLPEKNLLAILCDDCFFLATVQTEADLLRPPRFIKAIDFGNAEGVCFDKNRLLIANEKGEMWFFPLNELLAH